MHLLAFTQHCTGLKAEQTAWIWQCGSERTKRFHNAGCVTVQQSNEQIAQVLICQHSAVLEWTIRLQALFQRAILCLALKQKTLMRGDRFRKRFASPFGTEPICCLMKERRGFGPEPPPQVNLLMAWSVIYWNMRQTSPNQTQWFFLWKKEFGYRNIYHLMQ